MHFINESIDRQVPLLRPGTSSGQRRLSQASLTSDLGPNTVGTEENASINNELIDREVEGDDLLRIMRRDEIELQNELFILAEQGEYKKFKSLIDGCNHHIDLCKFRGLHGFTLLHHAASRGHSSIVLELLKNNRDSVHLRNDLKETPLHLAAYHGHLLLVDLLLDYNADINAVNKDGETCLFYAVRRKMPAVIRLLIQRGMLPHSPPTPKPKPKFHSISHLILPLPKPFVSS
ncbi:ankyrin repeat domain-containing protein [archaeon]|nr:MAG: ankyrin repeat domain-containing protein [archaeon]